MPTTRTSADDAELSGTRRNSRVAKARECRRGGIVGGQPGNETLLGGVIGQQQYLVGEAKSSKVGMHDAPRAPALFCRREARPPGVEFRSGTQLVAQCDEAVIVTPPTGCGVQTTHLLVGRRLPIRVDGSRARVEKNM